LESLERISFDIPRSLLQELQHLAEREGFTDFNSFWIVWMPRFRDMVRGWHLTEAYVDDCLDKLRLAHKDKDKEQEDEEARS
jgi:hypothetical protein